MSRSFIVFQSPQGSHVTDSLAELLLAHSKHFTSNAYDIINAGYSFKDIEIAIFKGFLRHMEFPINLFQHQPPFPIPIINIFHQINMIAFFLFLYIPVSYITFIHAILYVFFQQFLPHGKNLP